MAAAEVGGQQQLAQAPVIAGLYQSGYTQALDEYNKLKAFSVQGAETAMKAGTVEQAQAQRELDVATANAQQRAPIRSKSPTGRARRSVASAH